MNGREFEPHRRLAASIVIRAIRDLFVAHDTVRRELGIKSPQNLEATVVAIHESARLFLEDDTDLLMVNGGVTLRWCCEVMDIDHAWLRKKLSAFSHEDLRLTLKRVIIELGNPFKEPKKIEDCVVMEPAQMPPPYIALNWESKTTEPSCL